MNVKPLVDHDWISRLIPPGSRVLDLGCGTGTLLAKLEHEKGVQGSGIEISQDCIQACIAKGLPAIQADIDEGLKDYPDDAFDFVILCRTLHLVHRPAYVLSEALRVGKHVIISFENEAHWKNRVRFLFSGEISLDNEPHDVLEQDHSRNYLTVKRLETLVQRMGIKIERRYFTRILHAGEVLFLPNARAWLALFVLTRNDALIATSTANKNDFETKKSENIINKKCFTSIKPRLT
nr:methionine biosynthesis protein MetW [Candidatus Sigynarchaeum springense]